MPLKRRLESFYGILPSHSLIMVRLSLRMQRIQLIKTLPPNGLIRTLYYSILR